MELSAWLRQQIAINGGTVHVRRDGAEGPLGADELAGELVRRLDGLTFHVRLVVDIHGSVEMLATTESDTSGGTESLQGVENVALPEWLRKGGRGPKPRKRYQVKYAMEKRLRDGKCTLEVLFGYTQAQMKQRFECRPKTFKKALTLIAEEGRYK